MNNSSRTGFRSFHLWESPYRKLAGIAILLVMILGGVMIALARFHHYETLKVVAGSFASLLATVVGAWLAFWFARLQNKEIISENQRRAAVQRSMDEAMRRQDLAFTMHREFSSDFMLQARTSASRLLASHPGRTYAELYEELSEGETRCLFEITEFYERLSLSIRHQRIDLSLVPELFGAYFVWWYLDALRDRVIAPDPTWPEHVRLQYLYDWMVEHSDPIEFKLWKRRAVTDR